jgi:hypothetical protein
MKQAIHWTKEWSAVDAVKGGAYVERLVLATRALAQAHGINATSSLRDSLDPVERGGLRERGRINRPIIAISICPVPAGWGDRQGRKRSMNT